MALDWLLTRTCQPYIANIDNLYRFFYILHYLTIKIQICNNLSMSKELNERRHSANCYCETSLHAFSSSLGWTVIDVYILCHLCVDTLLSSLGWTANSTGFVFIALGLVGQ